MALPSVGAIGTNLTSGSGTSAAPAVPSGVVSGSFVAFGMFLDGSAQTVTAPDGTWTEAEGSPINVSGGSHGLHVFYHRATGTESGNYGNFTWGSSTYRSGFTTRFVDVLASGTPFDSPTGAAESNSILTTTPAVSTTSADVDRLDVFFATNWSGGTWTAPATFTKQREGTDQVMVLCTHDHPTAGSTGSLVAVCTGADRSTAWVGALIGTTGAATAAPRGALVVPRLATVQAGVW